ncbi:MAG: hypothetical protein WC586_03765 [Methanoregula sp.]
MPRGRPKNLSLYEQTKVRKMRKHLSEQKITRFDRLHDAALLQTLHVDSSGKIFVSYDFFTTRMQDIRRIVSDFIEE